MSEMLIAVFLLGAILPKALASIIKEAYIEEYCDGEEVKKKRSGITEKQQQMARSYVRELREYEKTNPPKQ